MMMHSMGGLYDQLRTSLLEIDRQIKHVKDDITQQYPEEERDKIDIWYGTYRRDGKHVKDNVEKQSPEEARNQANVWYGTYRSDGKPALEGLLIARANLLSAMANLKAADVSIKDRRR